MTAHISQELFDLESPNFTGTSTQVRPTTTPDMTSLTTSSRKLSWKNCLKYSLRYRLVEFLGERFKQNFIHLSGAIGLTNLTDVTSLAASGWLQNAM